MGIKKKKREERRKLKTLKKLMKGREVYTPIIYVGVWEIRPPEIDREEKVDV